MYEITSKRGRSSRGYCRLLAAALLVLALVGISLSPAQPSPDEPSPSADVTPGCVVDTTGILGWWRGEDDLSAQVGSSLVGSAGFGDAVVGRGLVFDPDSSAVVEGFPTVGTAVTVEAWLRLDDIGVTQAVVTRWAFPSSDDSARSFGLLAEPGGFLSWQTDETTARRPDELRAFVPEIFDGSFHHVAATWDSAQTVVYVDGLVVTSRAAQGGILNAAASTPLRVGGKSGLGSPFSLVGELDEPTVWARALDASEVAAINTAGGSGKCNFIPVEQAKLTSVSAANDRFGQSVGVSGSTLVVGAPFSSIATQFAGAAYVYVGNGMTWGLQATLVASDAALVNYFGWSVSIDGDTLVVGSNRNNGNRGAAYVFTRVGMTWTQQAKLVAADAAPNDEFGYSLAIRGDTIVVGAPRDDDAGDGSGSAYVFTRSGTTWTQESKLVAADAAIGDDFGLSVGIDGDTAVVGSHYDDDAGDGSGSAYVFTRSATVWTQQAKLVPSDGEIADDFGLAVGVSGDTAVVGSHRDDDAGANSGSAYVFTRTASTWSQLTKLTSADAAAGDEFGYSVSVSGSTIAVGAYVEGGPTVEAGSVYIFTRGGTVWTELTKLVASDGAPGDRFGSAVAVSGTVVIGAYLDDNPGNNSGSAYVFAP